MCVCVWVSEGSMSPAQISSFSIYTGIKTHFYWVMHSIIVHCWMSLVWFCALVPLEPSLPSDDVIIGTQWKKIWVFSSANVANPTPTNILNLTICLWQERMANKRRLLGLILCPVVWLMGCEALKKTLNFRLKLRPLLVLVCSFPVARVSMERGVNVII